MPERHLVQKLSPYRPNQALHEGVRQGQMGHRLDIVDLQNPKVRCPPVRLEQGIMIGTEISGCTLTMNRGVEHAAEVGAIDRTAMHADTHTTGPTQLRDYDGQVKQREQEVLRARDSVGQPRNVA